MRENGMEFTEEEIASLANAIFQVLLHTLSMQYPILLEYSLLNDSSYLILGFLITFFQ
jgi:hypothetical protein